MSLRLSVKEFVGEVHARLDALEERMRVLECPPEARPGGKEGRTQKMVALAERYLGEVLGEDVEAMGDEEFVARVCELANVMGQRGKPAFELPAFTSLEIETVTRKLERLLNRTIASGK